MTNSHAQNVMLKVIFPTNWNKKNTRKRPRPEFNYDSLFFGKEK
jgi:hypothetical protein